MSSEGKEAKAKENKEDKKMNVNEKIARINKSCRAGEIVTKVLFIIALVGFIAAVASGVTILSLGDSFDTWMQQDDGSLSVSVGGSLKMKLVDIDLGDFSELHSDVPALQKLIDAHPYSIMFGGYCLLGAFLTAVLAVMMKLVGSVFTLIRQEETPFTDKVIKRVVIAMAVTSGILLCTTSAGIGVLGGILTWVVYTILDYGKTLQIQSDETL